MAIHDYDLIYDRAKKVLEKAPISQRNKELIMSFVNDRFIQGITKVRLVKYMIVLKYVAVLVHEKDLDKVEIFDLKEVVAIIQGRADYAAWTKHMYKVVIRSFYKWLAGTRTYPPLVDWITIRISRSEKNLPSEGELLSESDVQRLLTTADHPRDKALIAVLWESGARISEIGNLKKGNVAFDTHGAVISVKGKTGSRKIRLLFSTSYLSTWLNMHPLRNDHEAPVWVNIGTTNHNESMNYAGIRKFFKRLFIKAGLGKRSNPHLFRHSRATFMAHHLTEFQMNQYFGWTQGSKMPSTYIHMSGKDIDSALFRMNGIHIGQAKEESKLLPVRCPRCETLNSSEDKQCSKCACILDMKYAMELEEKRRVEQEMRTNADSLMNMLLKDKDVQKLLMEKMKGFQGNPIL